jgi:CheY-like chemotaxis protein
MDQDEKSVPDVSGKKIVEDSSNSIKSLEDAMTQKKEVVSLEGKKIVWVEDDQFLNDIITRKLKATKCILFHASEGQEALQVIVREIPDVIMLDVILSGVDGFEILEKIKSDPKTKHIPVILLSNLGQASDIEKGKNLGADKFLVKATVTLDEIIDQIKEVVSK